MMSEFQIKDRLAVLEHEYNQKHPYPYKLELLAKITELKFILGDENVN